jgi:hypothetical protein
MVIFEALEQVLAAISMPWFALAAAAAKGHGRLRQGW